MDEPFDFQAALDHNQQVAGGSIYIQYGGLQVWAPKKDVLEGLEIVGGLTRPKRRFLLKKIIKTLDEMVPKVLAETTSQRQAVETAKDMVIWFAFEVLEGRASLKPN